jgi:hypothetical protein
VFGGAARRGQDLAGAIDCHGHGAQFRPSGPGRRARRGRNSWPPAHVHRGAAGQDHPVAQEGGQHQPRVPARRGRQDVGRFPRRSRGGAAGSSGSRAEQQPSATTTSTSTTTCPTSCSSPRRTTCRAFRCRCRIAWRSSRSLATPSSRNWPSPGSTSFPSRNATTAWANWTSPCPRKPCARSSRATPRKPACAAWSARSPRSAARSPASIWPTGRRPPGRSRPSACSSISGRQRFRVGQQQVNDEVGVTNGLAVTSHGGDLLVTEVSIVSGKGKLVLTGQLGDVMQESAQAAISYIRSRAPSLGIDRDFYSRADIHVHLPEGAIPKDGPSAGITICTGMVSALLAHQGSSRRGHDRRDHPARPGAAHRWPQGKDPGRPSRRHFDGAVFRRTTPRTCATSPSAC